MCSSDLLCFLELGLVSILLLILATQLRNFIPARLTFFFQITQFLLISVKVKSGFGSCLLAIVNVLILNLGAMCISVLYRIFLKSIFEKYFQSFQKSIFEVFLERLSQCAALFQCS